jgi:hypothetical protein
VTGDLIQRCVCSFRSSPPSFPQNTEFPNCSWLEYEDNDTCECICSEESVNRPKCESASREYDNSNCECKECDEGFTYSQSRKMCVTAQFYCMTCEQLTPQELETLLQSDPEAKGFDTEADCVCPVNVCESYRYGTFHNGSYTFDCSTQGYAQCPPDFYRCHSCNPAPGSPTSSQCQYVYDGRYIVTQCCDAQGPIPGRPSFCNSLGFADACNDPPSYWTVDPSGAGFEGLMVYNTYTVVENCSNPGLFQTGTCG